MCQQEKQAFFFYEAENLFNIFEMVRKQALNSIIYSRKNECELLPKHKLTVSNFINKYNLCKSKNYFIYIYTHIADSKRDVIHEITD